MSKAAKLPCQANCSLCYNRSPFNEIAITSSWCMRFSGLDASHQKKKLNNWVGIDQAERARLFEDTRTPTSLTTTADSGVYPANTHVTACTKAKSKHAGALEINATSLSENVQIRSWRVPSLTCPLTMTFIRQHLGACKQCACYCVGTRKSDYKINIILSSLL